MAAPGKSLHVELLHINSIHEFQGGVERQFEAVSDAFIEDGHSITMVSSSRAVSNEPLNPQKSLVGLGIHSIARWWFIGPLLKLIRAYSALRKQTHSPNFIICPDPILAVASKLARPKLPLFYRPGLCLKYSYDDNVSDEKGMMFSFLKHQYFFIEKWALKKADGIICTSSQMKTQLSSIYRNNQFYVVNNPVSAAHINTPLSREKSDTLRFLYLGRLHKIKNVDLLLKAFAQLKLMNEDQAISLNIAGTGQQEDELKQLANSLMLQSSVKFLGYCEHPIDVLDQADILVMPSYYEPFGNVIPEAMSRGLITLSFKSNNEHVLVGANDVVSNTIDGVLINEPTVNGLLKAMQDIIKRPQFYDNFGTKAINKIQSNYSPEAITRKYISIYHHDA